MSHRVNCIIMGGGRGTRLYPLTKDRCKPAVPLAGKYRLVDIPISNCINSGYNRIYLLTQYNTASLHRHIQSSYKFDAFGGGFVDILSAEQTMEGESWYRHKGICLCSRAAAGSPGSSFLGFAAMARAVFGNSHHAPRVGRFATQRIGRYRQHRDRWRYRPARQVLCAHS